MTRFLLTVKEAAAGQQWVRESATLPGFRDSSALSTVVVEAETGAEAREAYEAQREAEGAVRGRGPFSPGSERSGQAVDADKAQFQVVKVEAL